MPGFELIGEEELKALTEIFTESNGVLFAHGFDERRKNIFRVRELEKELATKFKMSYCQAVSSGTASLYTIMKALNIGPGDEVITQSFTFVATIEAILACGAKPIVVDINETLNMCPRSLAQAITKKTKAIVPVHMLGNPNAMEQIIEIANKNSLMIIEDNCQSLGASYRGQFLGTFGQGGAFSLDFGKVISCGEGGFILTNDEQTYLKMRSFHDHGHDYNPTLPRGLDTASEVGFNFRMTEMQAAVARAQLKKLDFILSRNRENKMKLKEIISSLGDKIQFRTITDIQGELADTLMFFVESSHMSSNIVKRLSQLGIGTKNVPDAMKWHFAGNWKQFWRKHDLYSTNYETQWKNSSQLLDRCISLPIMLKWEENDIQKIGERVYKTIKDI